MVIITYELQNKVDSTNSLMIAPNCDVRPNKFDAVVIAIDSRRPGSVR